MQRCFPLSSASVCLVRMQYLCLGRQNLQRSKWRWSKSCIPPFTRRWSYHRVEQFFRDSCYANSPPQHMTAHDCLFNVFLARHYYKGHSATHSLVKAQLKKIKHSYPRCPFPDCSHQAHNGSL